MEFCSSLQISEALMATWMKIDPYWYGWVFFHWGLQSECSRRKWRYQPLYRIISCKRYCTVSCGVTGVGNELWSAASLLSCYGSGWSAFLWRGRRPATTDSCHWFIQQGHFDSPLSYRTASVKIPLHQSLLGWLTVNRPCTGRISCLGDGCFLISGPWLWNSSPVELCQPHVEIGQRRWLLKTFLFEWNYCT